VLTEYEKLGRQFDFGCCIYPTTPLLTSNLLIEGYETLKKQNYDTVFPVLRYSYPIQRSLRIENGKIRMNWPDHKNSRSQELYDAYHDAGQFYWFAIDKFRERKDILSNNSGALIISDIEAQDIDTLDDWELAEFKFEFRKKREYSGS
jgi:N-acylneuraminate cytidylyltransferase